jgi:hypothetical protein
MSAIDQNIFVARVDRCKTLNELLDLQKGFLKEGQGFRRLNGYYGAAMQIITHRNIKSFDKARVIKAVQAYKDDAAKLLKNEDFLSSIPQDQRPYLAQVTNGFRSPWPWPHQRGDGQGPGRSTPT